MINVNFKNPRYAIPIILLPFTLIFFSLYRSNFATGEVQIEKQDSLQASLATVSDAVKNKSITDKLEAFRDQFKEADGYTFIGKIKEEEIKNQSINSEYNLQEKKMLDSINRIMDKKADFQNRSASLPDFPSASTMRKGTLTSQQDDKTLAEALVKMSLDQRTEATPQPLTQPDPMQIFRQQMAFVDSMGKANDPDFKAEMLAKEHAAQVQNELSKMTKLNVTKSNSINGHFNTIKADRNESLITAIIDQDITGYAGSRLRIRLLDDIMVSNNLIERGSYLYCEVSGFAAQRVNLKVSSILHGGKILPVKLELYDNDGIPGLYVPASTFREFTKELGNNTTQGMTLQQQAENNNQLVMSMIQKMFQSTTTAVGKLIRSNKANIKYNTIVYLIDPEDLKNKQRNY